MDELIKNLGPAAAAVFVMWFMLQWLIRRLEAGDSTREAFFREFIQVLTTTIATNTQALSGTAASNAEVVGALEKLTGLLMAELQENNRRDRDERNKPNG